MITPNIHPKQFMVDLIGPSKDNEGFVLESFRREEEDYRPISFARAWRSVSNQKDKGFQNSEEILKNLDDIHNLSLSHLKRSSRVDSEEDVNEFDIEKGWNSDSKGLNDIIDKIWDNSKLHFSLKIRGVDDDFVLSYKGLYSDTDDTAVFQRSGKSQTEDLEVLEKIKEEIFRMIPEHTRGLKSPIFAIHEDAGTRREEAKKILDNYLKKITACKTDDEKLKTIATTLRDLSQIVLYQHGNNRSLYILANTLLSQNGLQL